MSTITLPTVSEYRAADVAGKAAFRTIVTKAMMQAIEDLDLDTAKATKSLLEEFVTKTSTPKAEVDWSQVAADRVATLRMAAALIESGMVDPSGFPEDWASSNEDGDRIELPNGTPDEELARKLASAKVTKSSDRADVGAGIEAAFADVPSGTFLTVQQITNKAGLPSAGAVAARLFPKSGVCTVPGVTPTEASATSPKGATKA